MKRTPSIMDVEYAYDLGWAHGKAHNTLAGFSNLTQAIQDGTPIDWWRLDGLKAKCVHPELGELTHKMERDSGFDLQSVDAWYIYSDYRKIWAKTFTLSWRENQAGHFGLMVRYLSSPEALMS